MKNGDKEPSQQPRGTVDPFADYGGRNRVTSMISQIFKVTAAIESGKISQEEGYAILKRSGIGEKELTELIKMVEEYR